MEDLFTGTGNTFQDQELAGCHTCNETTDNFRCIVEVHLAGCKETVAFHKVFQSDLVVIFRILEWAYF